MKRRKPRKLGTKWRRMTFWKTSIALLSKSGSGGSFVKRIRFHNSGTLSSTLWQFTHCLSPHSCLSFLNAPSFWNRLNYFVMRVSHWTYFSISSSLKNIRRRMTSEKLDWDTWSLPLYLIVVLLCQGWLRLRELLWTTKRYADLSIINASLSNLTLLQKLS